VSFSWLSTLIDPVWLDPNAFVRESIQTWIQEDSAAHGLVGSPKKLLGILTPREVAQAVVNYSSLDEIRINQVMRDPIAYLLKPDPDPKAILEFMKQHKLSILPIVDDQGLVVGILTQDQILQILSAQWLSSQTLVAKISSESGIQSEFSRSQIIESRQDQPDLNRDTDPKKPEFFLSHHQEFLEYTTQSTGVIVYLYDCLDGRNLFVNTEIESMLGYSPAEIQAMGREVLSILIHPDDLPRILARLKQSLSSTDRNHPLEAKYRMQHKDGSWRWLLSRDRVLTHTPEGSPWQLLGIATDITSLQETETQLRFSQDHLQIRARHQQTVLKLTQIIRESLVLEDILKAAVTEIQQTIQADRVVIYQLLPTQERLAIAEATQPEWGSLQGICFSELLFGDEYRELCHHQMFSLADINSLEESISQSAREFCRHWQIRAKLAVPIFVQDTLWGILVAHQCSGPRSWSSWDIELMKPLSDQLGIAIYQAELWCQLQGQVEQERLFTTITQHMRETFDLNTLFSTATQGLAQLIPCDQVVICQLKNRDSDQEIWQVVSDYRSQPHFPDAYGTTIASKDNPISDRLKQGIRVSISDSSQLQDPVNQALAKVYPGAWLILPIQINDLTWGALALHRLFLPGEWSTATIDLVTRMVNHLSLAISQTELYQKAYLQAEETQILAKISQRIRESMDVQDVWRAAVQEVREVLNTDRVVILRFNQDLIGSIVAEAVSHESFSILGVTIEDHCFKTHWQIPYQKGRISQIEDIETAPIEPCHAQMLRSLQVRANLVVPLLQGSHLWGLLIAHHCQGPRPWNPWAPGFMLELANYLSIAIQQAELFQKLQTSEERYRQILETAHEGIWLVDQEGITTFVNPYLGRMLGYTPEDMIGKSLFDFMDPEAQVIAHQQMARRRQGIREQHDFCFRHKNGSHVWTILSTNPIFNAQGDFIGTLGMVTDITDRKRFEAELLAAKETAEAANRAKSQFLAIMSHEIRTPLNAVLGMISLLENTQLTQQQQRFINTIRSGSEVLLNLISDILDFSRIEADMLEIEFEPVNLKADLQRVITLLDAKAQEKQLQLKLELAPEVPPVILGSSLRLKQILLNLISNAIKFTHSGSVTVSVEVLYKDPETTDCNLLFRVADTGIGIPPEQLDSIFQPFQQGDNSITRRYGGTGLGLAVCRRLVEMMGGEINLTSQVGVGSTFSFSLPTQALPEEKVIVTEENPPAKPLFVDKIADTYPHRILIVEDNPVNQTIICAMLTHLGYVPGQASHGQEALDYLSRESFDLILMDIEMPEMDGLTATKRIREQFGSDIYIIGLSAGAFSESRQMALDAGMNDYLTKPIELEILVQFLQDLPLKAPPTSLPNPLDPKVIGQIQSILGSDAELVISNISRIFLQDTEERLQKMKDAFQGSDTETLRQLAHGLKGTASQIGAHYLTQLAQDLEKVSKTGSDRPEMERLIAAITVEFEQVIIALQQRYPS
jgi:PAS domain S-box-containing protein